MARRKMDPGTWLENISKLGALPSLVVEKICRAVGMVYQPVDKILNAHADAYSTGVRARGDVNASDIHSRAQMRIHVEQLRHQQNIEAIIIQSLPHLNDQAKPAEVHDDWLVNFVDLARNTSKADLQALWAKILAGEFNTPNSFSKRTLRVAADFDRRDAELFTALSRFGVNINHDLPLIYDHQASIYNSAGLDYGALAHLESVGVIRFNDVAGFVSKQPSHRVLLPYFDKSISATFPGDHASTTHSLQLGYVMLTQPGKELVSITGATPVDGFIEYLSERLTGFGMTCQVIDLIPQGK